MKAVRYICLVLVIVLAVCCLSSCGESADDITISSISIVGANHVFINEFNYDDYNVVVRYSDGKTMKFVLTKDMISSEDRAKLLTLGDHSITVSFRGVSTKFNILVEEKFPNNITYSFEEVTPTKNSNPTTFYIGADIDLVDPILPEGYIFNGWYKKNPDTEEYEPITKVDTSSNEDVTIYGLYTLEQYKITYDLDGGNYVSGLTKNPSTYNVATNTFTLITPVKAQYSFAGWVDENGKSVSAKVLKGSTGNKTFKATWGEKVFTASDYFAELWKVSRKVGNEPIGKTDSIVITADTELSLNVKMGAKTTQTVDIGLLCTLVLDKEDGSDTALKLGVYDPTKKDEKWTTIYFFVSDANYIYVDYANEHFKLGIELDDGASGGIHKNSFLGTWLNNKFNAIPEDGGPTIYDQINTMTEKMGPDWSLNAFMTDVLKLLNFNVTNYLHGVQQDGVTKDETNTIGPIIASALKLFMNLKSVDDLFDSTGSLDVEKMLTSGILDSLFRANKSSDGKVWKASLKSSALSLILGFVKDYLPIENITSLIGENSNLLITFTEDDKGNYESVMFTLGLGELASKDNGFLYPEINLKVNSLQIRKADENNLVQLKDATYQDKFEMYAEMSIDLNGFSIRDHHKNLTYDLTGKYTLSVNMVLDLKNGPDSNTTQILAILSKDNDAVIKLLFEQNKLSIKLCDDAKVKCGGEDVCVARVIIEDLGDALFQMLNNLYVVSYKYDETKQYYEKVIEFINQDGMAYDPLELYYGFNEDNIFTKLNVTKSEFEANSKLYYTKGAYKPIYPTAEDFEDIVESEYYTKPFTSEVIEKFKNKMMDKDGNYISDFSIEFQNMDLQFYFAEMIWQAIGDSYLEYAKKKEPKDATTSDDSDSIINLAFVADELSKLIEYLNTDNDMVYIHTSSKGLTADLDYIFKKSLDDLGISSMEYAIALIDELDGSQRLARLLSTFILDTETTGEKVAGFLNAFSQGQLYFSVDFNDEVGAELGLGIIANDKVSVIVDFVVTPGQYDKNLYIKEASEFGTPALIYDSSLEKFTKE